MVSEQERGAVRESKEKREPTSDFPDERYLELGYTNEESKVLTEAGQPQEKIVSELTDLYRKTAAGESVDEAKIDLLQKSLAEEREKYFEWRERFDYERTEGKNFLTDPELSDVRSIYKQEVNRARIEFPNTKEVPIPPIRITNEMLDKWDRLRLRLHYFPEQFNDRARRHFTPEERADNTMREHWALIPFDPKLDSQLRTQEGAEAVLGHDGVPGVVRLLNTGERRYLSDRYGGRNIRSSIKLQRKR